MKGKRSRIFLSRRLYFLSCCIALPRSSKHRRPLHQSFTAA